MHCARRTELDEIFVEEATDSFARRSDVRVQEPFFQRPDGGGGLVQFGH
jgi:hypothetical protein